MHISALAHLHTLQDALPAFKLDKSRACYVNSTRLASEQQGDLADEELVESVNHGLYKVTQRRIRAFAAQLSSMPNMSTKDFGTLAHAGAGWCC